MGFLGTHSLARLLAVNDYFTYVSKAVHWTALHTSFYINQYDNIEKARSKY
jgi:hypothetical protein